MPWKRHGDYAINDGDHWIAMLKVNGEPGFLVWLNGKLVPGRVFKSTAEAKDYVRRKTSA